MSPQPLPISALQHLSFCKRQCALIHIERLWAENRLTIEGQHLHQKVHDSTCKEKRSNIKYLRGIDLWSSKYNIIGKADLVEIHYEAHSTKKMTRIIPVEYKHGKPKSNNSDTVQLCAQALCLEEMFNMPISSGHIYYGRTHKRLIVDFDTVLLNQTQNLISELHSLIQSGITPTATYSSKCDQCSLINICMPHALKTRNTASRYIQKTLALTE